jgi:putative alpha-1,2-mannosidase
VEIKDVTPEQRQLFYTSLYHTMLMPVGRTGENPLWKSSEPYFDDSYAIWDTFRSSAPLLTIIASERQASSVRALIDIFRYDGNMPDTRNGNFNGRTQGGSNAEFF